MTSPKREQINMTENQITDFYERWKEWMVVAHRRGAVVVTHPDDEGFFIDLLDRLREDLGWKSVAGIFDPARRLLYMEQIGQGNMMFWTKEEGLQTPKQFIGNVGFGRMNIARPSSDGVQPWHEFKVPKEPNKLIELIRQRKSDDDGDLH
jgi:hypothetical protein